MFELIALWMIIGLFCAGFWLVVSASWAGPFGTPKSTLELHENPRTSRREART